MGGQGSVYLGFKCIPAQLSAGQDNESSEGSGGAHRDAFEMGAPGLGGRQDTERRLAGECV